jgi:hypothetical protein
MATIPFNERLGYTIDDAIQGSGLGRTSIYALIGDGTLKSKMVCGRRIIDGESFRKLICSNDEEAAA